MGVARRRGQGTKSSKPKKKKSALQEAWDNFDTWGPPEPPHQSGGMLGPLFWPVLCMFTGGYGLLIALALISEGDVLASLPTLFIGLWCSWKAIKWVLK